MADIEQKIIDAVEEQREDLIEFYRELIRIPSFTGQEREVAVKLAEGLKKRGLTDVQIVEKEPGRSNVVAYYRGAEDGPTCTFNGHLDVLPPQKGEVWEHKPFDADMVDGKIYGRGTVDMKSGTMSSFFSGIVLSKLGIPIRGKVCYTGVCDELVSGDKGVIHLIEQGYIRKDHPEDFGFNCEPTGLQKIEIATKGVYRTDVIIHGKGGYNARPWFAINAIDKAAKFIPEIQKLNDALGKDPAFQHKFLLPRTISVAMISGGEASNMVPATVKMVVTRRMHPGETFEKCFKEQQDIIDRLHAEDPEFVAEVRPWPGQRPPVEISETERLVEAARHALKRVNGTDIIVTGSEGGTDGSHVVARTGIPMPVFGPAMEDLLATTDEHVDVEMFIDAIKVYALIVYYMLGI